MTAEKLLQKIKKELINMPEDEFGKTCEATYDPDFVSLGPGRVDIWLDRLKKGGE